MRRKKAMVTALIGTMILLSQAFGMLPTSAQKTNVISVTYQFDASEILRWLDTYQCVENLRVQGEPGEPLAPYRTAKILLPPYSKVANVSVEMRFGGKHFVKDILCGQPAVVIGEEPKIVEKNPTIYNSDELYPRECYRVGSVCSFRGYNILHVRLYPVQYQPSSKLATYYTEMTVYVILGTGNGMDKFRNLAKDKKIATTIVDNPEILSTYDSTLVTTETLGTTYEYIIVTTPDLADEFQVLADWKANFVDGAKVVTVNYGASDTEIKNVINNYYTNYGTSYVLLGGDVSVITYHTKFVETPSAQANIAEDYWYANLVGDDDISYYEVYIGRAPVDNGAEATNFVNKVIAYEQMPKPRANLFHESRVGADNDPEARELAWQCEQYVPAGYTHYELFEENGRINKTDWINFWRNDGIMCEHEGHGDSTFYYISYDNGSSPVKWYNTDVASLDNTFWPVHTSPACFSGQFRVEDCLAEAYVKDDHGAIACLMNDKYGWYRAGDTTYYSGDFIEMQFKALYQDGWTSIGSMLAHSKHYFIDEANSDPTWEWCWREINLIGDPETCLLIRPDHDVRVSSWKLPFVSEPGDTVLVNATVLNWGKSIERNIRVNLLVNGRKVDSKRIDLLESLKSATVNFLWTPTNNGTYNVTARVEPVKGESYTEDNIQSAYSWVKPRKTVRVPDDFPTIKEAVETTNLWIYYGDATIWVASGTYNEYDLLIRTKLTSLMLVGENRSSIIDSQGKGFATLSLYASNVTVTGFTMKNSTTGVRIRGAYNTVSDNTMSDNKYYGISLLGFSNNTVSGNIMSDNGLAGINHRYSSGNTISNNIILNGTLTGIDVIFSSGNTISNNKVSNIVKMEDWYTGNGILLQMESRYNWVVGNTISNNYRGMFLFSSGSNNIYHNNFIDNTWEHVYNEFSVNNWDDGYPSGGNYWSGYTAVDEKSGPNQDQPGSDGIGDTPYVIDAWNQDNYPLVHPWGSIRNVDTGKIYLTIQKAMDAPETLDGHTIEVKAGTYHENAVVNKSLTLMGEDPSTTILEGKGGHTIIVQANNVTISQFTIQNSYLSGILLYYSNYSTVSDNIVLNSTFFGIYLINSSNNTVCNNTISNNAWGISLQESDNNVVYHNSFMDNTYQVYSSASTNTWDDGYPSGGNYWSDYTGVDEKSGPNQDQPGSDGIGDTPYVIDAWNQDNYPLMNPWNP